MLIKNNKELKQKDFKDEKELQKYFENNLEQILNYQYVRSEFTVGDFRIDTLAYDRESQAFIIIEFKNVVNRSLIDQGYTYLGLLLERKKDFVYEYNKINNASLLVEDIDWSQSRIIFVSPIFTAYQLNATKYKCLPFDLYKVVKYEDDLVSVEKIMKTSDIKINQNILSTTTPELKEIKVVSEQDLIDYIKIDEVKRVYEVLKNRILELDDIDKIERKTYIAFKGSKNIISVVPQKNRLNIIINMKIGTLKDPLNLTKDISHTKTGLGDYQVDISSIEEIDSIIPLIKQSIEKNKK